jgi:hypothetical protein
VRRAAIDAHHGRGAPGSGRQFEVLIDCVRGAADRLGRVEERGRVLAKLGVMEPEDAIEAPKMPESIHHCAQCGSNRCGSYTLSICMGRIPI